jgi:hypothetical protein
MAGSEPHDWQMNRSLQECNRYMLEHRVECDVKFLVGPEDGVPEEIQAHKYMLVSRSPVFFAMLCGGLRETGEVIRVPDVTTEAFRQLLK